MYNVAIVTVTVVSSIMDYNLLVIIFKKPAIVSDGTRCAYHALKFSYAFSEKYVRFRVNLIDGNKAP